jgi:hypothetical protein
VVNLKLTDHAWNNNNCSMPLQSPEMPVFQCVLFFFFLSGVASSHILILVNLNSLSKTAVLKAEFVPTVQSSLSLLMLSHRPAELEYSEWVCFPIS